MASEWETGSSGPARRVYSITEAGERMLLGWTDVVSGYQKMITGFFDLYSQVFGLVPPHGEEDRGEPPSSEESGSTEPEAPPAT